MILLDSDIMIDLLRQYPPAIQWFDTLAEEAEIVLPGLVVMELIQDCSNRTEQGRLQQQLANYGTVWPVPEDCQRALEVFIQYRLGHRG